MSENQNCRIQDFSKYDEMTTEELEEILRLDAKNTEDQESDTEKILYIMEVLTKRRMNNGHTGNTAQEAYESFKQHYMPEVDTTKSRKHICSKNRCWLHGLVATAAVLVLVISGSLTAKAFGFDVWKAVIQWTQETFHFGNWGNNPNEGNDLPYKSLQEALASGGITKPLAPTWIPGKYKLVDISTARTPLQKTYRATYRSGEQILKITVHDYLDKAPLHIEQSEGLVEEYVVSEITYYLFANFDSIKAVWITDSYECIISGNVTIEDLKQMINSIEKG